MGNRSGRRGYVGPAPTAIDLGNGRVIGKDAPREAKSIGLDTSVETREYLNVFNRGTS